MKHAMKYLFLAAGLCAVRPAAGYSSYYRLFGNSCFSTTTGVKAEPSPWGVYNPSTTQAMDVSCPVVLPDQIYTYAYLGIGGYNRSNTDAISCTLNFSSDDGYDYLSVKAAMKKMSGSGIVYVTAYNYPTSTQRNPWVTCHVPAYGTGYSYLTSVYITFQY